MKVLFAIAVFWFLVNVVLLLSTWLAATRDIAFAIDIPTDQLRRLTRSLRFLPALGLVQWVRARGKPWQKGLLIQFAVGLPLFAAVIGIYAATHH